MRACLTGHRPDKLYGYNISNIQYLFLKTTLKRILIEKKCTEAYCGMALGADIIFALAVIELKQEGYNIKLHCAIPCKNHTAKWKDSKWKDIYYYILSQADDIYINNKNYDNFCMQERNIYMVDNSDFVIAVYNGSAGGTKNCINYAEQKNKEIIFINPNYI